MYGSWTENVVLWRIFLGFIWDILNVLKIYNYWVWAQVDFQNHPLRIDFEKNYQITTTNNAVV